MTTVTYVTHYVCCCCCHHILLPWQPICSWCRCYSTCKNILNWQNAKNRSNGIFGYYITSGTFWYIIHVLRKWHDIHTYSMISTKNLNIHTYSMISTKNLHRIRTTHTVKWGNDMIFAHMMNQWLVYYVGPRASFARVPAQEDVTWY